MTSTMADTASSVKMTSAARTPGESARGLAGVLAVVDVLCDSAMTGEVSEPSSYLHSISMRACEKESSGVLDAEESHTASVIGERCDRDANSVVPIDKRGNLRRRRAIRVARVKTWVHGNRVV